MNDKLFVTLDGPQFREDSVPLDDFIAALQGVKEAVRLMVGHLGGHQPGRGKPPKWVREQSSLRLNAPLTGSYVAVLTLDPPRNERRQGSDYGERALTALQNWDGGYDSGLPRVVTDKLCKIPNSLPESTRIWLGDGKVGRRVEIKRPTHLTGLPSRTELGPVQIRVDEEAILHGWLKEVNWDTRTAALHCFRDQKVQLRFGRSLDEELRRSANRFVTVRGHGQFDKYERWKYVTIETIEGDHSSSEPFDLEAFLNNPAPKIFDPKKVVRASEPFDVDEFIRFIREGRDA